MKHLLLKCATTTCFLFSFTICFAQAPVLGTAADFILFSRVGAVGNTSISHITGNMGTNSGAITAFGNVNGVIHNADGATSQASADLLNAYTQLDTITATLFIAPSIANGDTLAAGVYAIEDNATINDTLVLDAAGNPGAIFIFKVQGTLTSADSSRIILANGAVACNVFWKVEGQVSLGVASSMKGTIIANNAAIDLQPGVTLEGRALTTSGAITINKVLAYIPVGCGMPLLTGPAPPALASAACYTIFSGNGAVMNDGVTNVTGDIGSNVNLTTGYDPLRVNGIIHLIPDMSTAACAADLLNAYSYLNTLPVDINLLFPAQFGGNLVLTPHVYLMNSAAFLTDTVFLDAQGNADAVFVITVNGAFATSTHAKVALVNGASANNIFWKIEGAVSISDSSDFKGTIIAHNGAVDISAGTVLEGRAFTTNGALSTAFLNVEALPGVPCSVLPVTWLYFRGTPVQKNISLQWATTNEINNGFFTIEKGSDGRNFETLAKVNALPGVATNAYYNFTDLFPFSVNYYRISHTDRDGVKLYYRTIEIKGNVPGFQAIHYVGANYINVEASGIVDEKGILALYTLDGRKISTQNIKLTMENSSYKVDKPLQKGVYFLQIESHGKTLYTGKLAVL